MSRASLYQGIDLANSPNKVGYSVLEDDGEALSVLAKADLQPLVASDFSRRAIDCHFGYTLTHTRILRGKPPAADERHSRQFALWRKTEDWYAAKQFPSYTIKKTWDSRDVSANEDFKGDFFNKGSHVVPACGMRVIPRCLVMLFESFGKGLTDEERVCRLQSARRGEEQVVEAHPRLFMYSLLERIHRHTPLTCLQLSAAAKYKQQRASKERNRERRREILLVMQAGFQMAFPQRCRRRLCIPSVDEVTHSDHDFDAFLAALTAWAHQNEETVTWSEAHIEREFVNAEGHISVLPCV